MNMDNKVFINYPYRRMGKTYNIKSNKSEIMKEITPIDKKNAYVGRNFRKQISWIYIHGCNGIKCVDCCMQKICDRFPEHSKTLAYNLLMYAYEKAKQDNRSGK